MASNVPFPVFVGKITLFVSANTSVKEFMELVDKKTGWSIVMQRLTYAGKPLIDDERTLADYNIQKNSTIVLNGRLRGGDPKVPLFVLCCLLCAVCAYCFLFAGWRGCP